MRVQNPYLRITLFQLLPGVFILLCAYLGSFIPTRSAAIRRANERLLAAPRSSSSGSFSPCELSPTDGSAVVSRGLVADVLAAVAYVVSG